MGEEGGDSGNGLSVRCSIGSERFGGGVGLAVTNGGSTVLADMCSGGWRRLEVEDMYAGVTGGARRVLFVEAVIGGLAGSGCEGTDRVPGMSGWNGILDRA